MKAIKEIKSKFNQDIKAKQEKKQTVEIADVPNIELSEAKKVEEVKKVEYEERS